MPVLHIRLILAAFVGLSSPAAAQLYFGQATALDGDSLQMTGATFALAGIDALEARQTCLRGDKVWNCGEHASAALKALVDGKRVKCTQRGTDALGQVIATCTVDGRNLGQEMVRMGLAVALVGTDHDYGEWEDLARLNSAGIWSTEFQAPAEFRASDPLAAQEMRAMQAERERQLKAMEAERNAPRAVYYSGCREARAAGATPLYRGQPGYRPGMDGDGDGIACEDYPRRR